MAGVEGQGPFLPAALYQVSCRLLGCRLANTQPGSRPYAWLFFYWIRGVHAGLKGGGSTKGSTKGVHPEVTVCTDWSVGQRFAQRQSFAPSHLPSFSNLSYLSSLAVFCRPEHRGCARHCTQKLGLPRPRNTPWSLHLLALLWPDLLAPIPLRHAMPHSAQPQHTNDWAPRTRKRHREEHRPQRPDATCEGTNR